MLRELREHASVHAAGADLAAASRLEILRQQRSGYRAKRRHRREAVDDRNVGEDPAHRVAVRLAITLVQRLRNPFRVGLRLAEAHQRPADLGGDAVAGVAVQRVAAE